MVTPQPTSDGNLALHVNAVPEGNTLAEVNTVTEVAEAVPTPSSPEDAQPEQPSQPSPEPSQQRPDPSPQPLQSPLAIGSPVVPLMTAVELMDIIQQFQSATRVGDEKLATKLLTEYPHLDLMNVPLDNGECPLHAAIQNRNEKLVFYLLQNGASVKLKR